MDKRKEINKELDLLSIENKCKIISRLSN